MKPSKKTMMPVSISTSAPTWLLVLVSIISFFSSFRGTVSGASLEISSGMENPHFAKFTETNPFLTSSPSSSLSPKEKRSLSHQPLCGLRLLDALRTVCARNFVSRRADPTLTFQHSNNGEGQSSEMEISGGGMGSGSNTWESLNPEYLQFFNQPTTTGFGAHENWEELELMQPSWPKTSKAFAMKLLTEPSKTHQRFRRNIIEECCQKSCAPNQMLKYCG